MAIHTPMRSEVRELSGEGAGYGVRLAVKTDTLFDVGVLLAIECVDGPLVLSIGAPVSMLTQRLMRVRREVVESLLEQLNKELAVEALEGR